MNKSQILTAIANSRSENNLREIRSAINSKLSKMKQNNTGILNKQLQNLKTKLNKLKNYKEAPTYESHQTSNAWKNAMRSHSEYTAVKQEYNRLLAQKQK